MLRKELRRLLAALGQRRIHGIEQLPVMLRDVEAVIGGITDHRAIGREMADAAFLDRAGVVASDPQPHERMAELQRLELPRTLQPSSCVAGRSIGRSAYAAHLNGGLLFPTRCFRKRLKLRL